MAYILNVIHTNVPALQYKQKQLDVTSYVTEHISCFKNYQIPNLIINSTR